MKWQFEISDCPINPTYPVTAHQINDSGVKRGPFYLTIDDFLDAITQEPDNLLDADDFRSNEKSTPALPFGTIRYSANEAQTKERVTIEIQQKQWEIRYGEELNEIYTIGFPRMAVQYLVIKQSGKLRISEMRIYAVLNDGQPIIDDTPLYFFPYPNVGKGNAIVCWGLNQRLEVKSLVELERAFLWFVSAPFNEDHGVRTTHGINRFRKLIDMIQDEPFNDEWLMPMNKTYGDLYKEN